MGLCMNCKMVYFLSLGVYIMINRFRVKSLDQKNPQKWSDSGLKIITQQVQLLLQVTR